jgi:hypothetical protein
MVIFLFLLLAAFLLGNWIGLWFYRLHPEPKLSGAGSCSSPKIADQGASPQLAKALAVQLTSNPSGSQAYYSSC